MQKLFAPVGAHGSGAGHPFVRSIWPDEGGCSGRPGSTGSIATAPSGDAWHARDGKGWTPRRRSPRSHYQHCVLSVPLLDFAPVLSSVSTLQMVSLKPFEGVPVIVKEVPIEEVGPAATVMSYFLADMLLPE